MTQAALHDPSFAASCERVNRLQCLSPAGSQVGFRRGCRKACRLRSEYHLRLAQRNAICGVNSGENRPQSHRATEKPRSLPTTRQSAGELAIHGDRGRIRRAISRFRHLEFQNFCAIAFRQLLWFDRVVLVALTPQFRRQFIRKIFSDKGVQWPLDRASHCCYVWLAPALFLCWLGPLFQASRRRLVKSRPPARKRRRFPPTSRWSTCWPRCATSTARSSTT